MCVWVWVWNNTLVLLVIGNFFIRESFLTRLILKLLALLKGWLLLPTCLAHAQLICICCL